VGALALTGVEMIIERENLSHHTTLTAVLHEQHFSGIYHGVFWFWEDGRLRLVR
jgi:hypothetical protein